MIINLRYHIFTITSIFAALGLGILIGSSLIGHEGLLEEQRHIIQNIRNDINQLKNENKNLSAMIDLRDEQLGDRKQLERKVFDILLRDYMKSEKLFLIYNNLEPNKVEQLTEYIRIMGADLELMKYEQLDIESLLQDRGGCEAFDRFISWNLNNTIADRFKAVKMQNTTFIEYDKDDVLGLVVNMLTEIEKTRNSISAESR